jgi:membrane protein
VSSPLESKRDEAVEWAEDVSSRGQAWLAKHEKLSNWVTLGREVVVAQGETRISLVAAGAAFWLVIAIFPTVIAAVSIFGLVFSPEEIVNAINQINAPGAGSITSLISTQAQDIGDSTVSSLTFGLLISLLVALWAVSNGAYNLARAIRIAFEIPNLPYIKSRLRAFFGGIAAVIGLGLLAIAFVGIGRLNEYLTGVGQFVVSALVVWPLSFALLTGGIVTSYRFATAKSGRHLPALPGACFSTVTLALLAWGVSLTIAGLGTASPVYGIAAGAVSTLITAYLAMYLVLLGALINAHWPGIKALVTFRTSNTTESATD